MWTKRKVTNLDLRQNTSVKMLCEIFQKVDETKRKTVQIEVSVVKSLEHGGVGRQILVRVLSGIEVLGLYVILKEMT